MKDPVLFWCKCAIGVFLAACLLSWVVPHDYLAFVVIPMLAGCYYSLFGVYRALEATGEYDQYELAAAKWRLLFWGPIEAVVIFFRRAAR